MATNFYGILVADKSFHGQEALTYRTSANLEPGKLVVVPLKDKQVLGIVRSREKRPSFEVKEISSTPPYPKLPHTSLELMDWMRGYYPAPWGIITQLFVPFAPPKDYASPEITDVPGDTLPILTRDQKHAIRLISFRPGLHILHGETGTGKTRVYIELAKKNIQNKKSIIILSPEIGLTSQLVRDFKASFGRRVTLIHSKLPLAERRKAWFKVLKEKEPQIVIGPRSALFSPLDKIGLIVVDESHDTSYKQDRAPYYHTSYVAAKLAQLNKATLVLGSATPSVTDYIIAKLKQRPIVKMTESASSIDQEYSTNIVDLKDRSNFTQSRFLSDSLIGHVREALKRREQILLFLNRRGTARLVSCDNCNWRASCSRCDSPLVYHGDSHTMVCHSCDRRTSPPAYCPECSQSSIVFKSAGTKAVADEVARLFSSAKIQRFDTDNKSGERIEKHLESLHRGDIDIIVGTQTLAKGLDLPRLSLVGVLLADSSMYFPDFSAPERTYQLLHQVLGRVGRGHRKSHATIQTFMPESPLIRAAVSKDWESFYKKEVAERQKFRFPPYYYLLKLTCRRASVSSAEKSSQSLADKLKKDYQEVIIEGPAPCFYEKSQGKYQWQLILKSKTREHLLDIIKSLPSNWSYDIDPMDLL